MRAAKDNSCCFSVRAVAAWACLKEAEASSFIVLVRAASRTRSGSPCRPGEIQMSNVFETHEPDVRREQGNRAGLAGRGLCTGMSGRHKTQAENWCPTKTKPNARPLLPSPQFCQQSPAPLRLGGRGQTFHPDLRLSERPCATKRTCERASSY